MLSLTPTQYSIIGYLALQSDWVSGKDIFGAIYHPDHDFRNVRVQIFKARQRGVLIESHRRRGYRLAEPIDNRTREIAKSNRAAASSISSSLHGVDNA